MTIRFATPQSDVNPSSSEHRVHAACVTSFESRSFGPIDANDHSARTGNIIPRQIYADQAEPAVTQLRSAPTVPLSTVSNYRHQDDFSFRVSVGDLKIDPARCEIQVGSRVVRLTRTEYRLLATLASDPGRVFSRPELIRASRGLEANSEDRTIDVHIRNLRFKVREFASQIETVRGFGYAFREPHHGLR